MSFRSQKHATIPPSASGSHRAQLAQHNNKNALHVNRAPIPSSYQFDTHTHRRRDIRCVEFGHGVRLVVCWLFLPSSVDRPLLLILWTRQPCRQPTYSNYASANVMRPRCELEAVHIVSLNVQAYLVLVCRCCQRCTALASTALDCVGCSCGRKSPSRLVCTLLYQRISGTLSIFDLMHRDIRGHLFERIQDAQLQQLPALQTL